MQRQRRTVNWSSSPSSAAAATLDLELLIPVSSGSSLPRPRAPHPRLRRQRQRRLGPRRRRRGQNCCLLRVRCSLLHRSRGFVLYDMVFASTRRHNVGRAAGMTARGFGVRL